MTLLAVLWAIVGVPTVVTVMIYLLGCVIDYWPIWRTCITEWWRRRRLVRIDAQLDRQSRVVRAVLFDLASDMAYEHMRASQEMARHSSLLLRRRRYE